MAGQPDIERGSAEWSPGLLGQMETCEKNLVKFVKMPTLEEDRLETAGSNNTQYPPADCRPVGLLHTRQYSAPHVRGKAHSRRLQGGNLRGVIRLV